MQKTATRFLLVLIAFISLGIIMSFAKPAPDAPRQYTVVIVQSQKKFEGEVNQLLSEGWHLEGGVSSQGGSLLQALSK